MRTPADMRTIQIDITNACVHRCSNCTRFCGHHKKPFFMDFETFQKAVDSLEGFDKCIGVMGGEPTLHPDFERFAKYIGEKHPSAYTIPSSKKPLLNLGQYIHDKNYILDEMLNRRKGPGLWSSVCESYYKNFELIQDTFSFQNINDHNNRSLHKPLLVSRKDMGIRDEDWIAIRDNCWIQNQWSASITPKGAFFCEVAGALDMLFDGPGGWKIEKGWWKRTPEEFGEQLQWCEICGAAFMQNGRLSSEELDDVSPHLYEMLQKAESPKLKQGRVLVMDIQKQEALLPMSTAKNCYLEEHSTRVSQSNRAIYPHSIKTLIYIEREGASIGESICREFYKAETDWIIYSKQSDTADALKARLENVVLNPGVLYFYGDTVIFNGKASALRGNFAEIRELTQLSELKTFYEKEKIVFLEDDFDRKQNPDVKDWYSFADALKRPDKEDVYRCLDKIRSDYEQE